MESESKNLRVEKEDDWQHPEEWKIPWKYPIAFGCSSNQHLIKQHLQLALV